VSTLFPPLLSAAKTRTDSPTHLPAKERVCGLVAPGVVSNDAISRTLGARPGFPEIKRALNVLFTDIGVTSNDIVTSQVSSFGMVSSITPIMFASELDPTGPYLVKILCYLPV